MEAKAKAVSEILYSGNQFLVPYFQRNYLWQKKHWKRLWNDILNLLDDEERKHHFLGPLVCASMKSQPGEIQAFQLIDGQQRLTTLSVLLATVRDAAQKLDNKELAAEISETYLVNRFKKGMDHFKIVPRLGDRELYFAIAEGKEVSADDNSFLDEAYEFFTKVTQSEASKKIEKVKQLFDAIVGRLYLVVITLDEENPYEIFESLNSTGLPLQESDLIRNFLFMQLPLEKHEEFQTEHWQSYEELFEADGEFSELPATKFYRDFLMREGNYSRAKSTFVDFKTYCQAKQLTSQQAVAELKHYLKLALAITRKGQGLPDKVANAIAKLEPLEATTANPLLLNLLGRYSANELNEEDLLGILSDFISFVVRRSFCGESTRTYGRWFCEAIGVIGETPRADLQSYFAHRGWPDDEAFIQHAKEFPAYRRESKKVRLILEAVEDSYGHKEKVDLSTLQIEHVMPQTLARGSKGKDWREMLGEEGAKVHKRLLHTVGNLTLTGYNPNLSNKPYEKKREEFLNSKLSSNTFFKETMTWNADVILSRSEQLAQKTVELWPRPEGIEEFKPANKREGVPRAGRERRHAYWTKLIELLEEKQSPWLPLVAPDGTVLELKLPNSNANLSVRFQLNKRRFEISLRCSHKRGRVMFEQLKRDRPLIDQQFEQLPVWESNSNRSVAVLLNNSTIKDPLDWHEQHTWIAARLSEFHAAFFDRLSKLENDVKKESPLKGQFLEYWTELRTHLLAGRGAVKPTKPRPQHWMSFAIGRSSVHLNALVNSQDKRICVDLLMAKKNSKNFFHQLYQDKNAIEEEIGVHLEWLEKPKKKQSRIAIYREDSDPLDRSQWPQQHEWIRQNLEAFYKAFHPRVKQLKAHDS